MLANNVAGKERNREELFNYMTKLYSNPDFSAESQTNLRQVFLDRFKGELESDTQVLSIWETEKSIISLLKVFYLHPSYDYEIYAEPVGQ